MCDCVEFCRKIFSCASVNAPYYILQCVLKSMVVPVMSIRREIVENMPLFLGIAFSQKTLFSTMWEIILFGKFL